MAKGKSMMTLMNYAFWAVAGYAAVAVIGALTAIGATIVAVQILRLLKGSNDV